MDVSRTNNQTAVRRRPHLRGETSLPRLAVERSYQMVRLYENWPTALADRLGVLRRPGHVLYRVRSGGTTVELIARANGCDVRTLNEIWIAELYDSLTDRSALRAHRPVVVDIGANCGYFSVYMAKRYPQARLVCFEPEPENRWLARANLALNKVQAELNSEAVVVDRSPTVTLNLSRDPRLHTTVSSEEADRHGISSQRYSGRSVVVPAVNINDAIAPLIEEGRIDLLKVDVEGIDLELVAAMDGRTLSRIDCIVAETEGRHTGSVADRLRAAQFSVSEDAGLLFAHRQREDGVARHEGASAS